MLATFLYGPGPTTLILADDQNFAGTGKIGFRWEEFSTTGKVDITPLFDSPIPSKRPFGNLDRKLGWRAQQSFLTVGGSYPAAIAALTAWLKALDAACGQSGSLTLQPDAKQPSVMNYANAILKGVTLLASSENTTGIMATVSLKFEPTSLT